MKRVARCIGAHVIAGVVIAWALLACGASAREKTLRASFVAVNAARDGFFAYDEQHQRTLLEAATDAPSWKATIADYRSRREKVVELFAGAYSTIAAATLLDKDAKSLDAVGEAMKLLFAAVKDFTGGRVSVPTGGLP
jgi:hypothetical protein